MLRSYKHAGLALTPLFGSFALLALFLACPFTRAQDPETAFRNTVFKHHRYLRDFNADNDIRGDWSSGAVQMQPPSVRMLGVFFTDHIKIGPDKIELQGKRYAAVRLSDTEVGFSPIGEEVRITLATHGGVASSVLPAFEQALFFPSSEAALAALPVSYRRALPQPINETCCSKPAQEDTPTTCDCANPTTNGCHLEPNSPMQNWKGVKAPRVIYQVDPEFSEEARRKKFSGDVSIGLNVDSSGKPSGLWIVHSVGMGLDGKAAEAVRAYRFTPATCHDVPVAYDLFIDVNFQMF